MSSLKNILAASAIAYLSTTSAHMVLSQPPPYGNPTNSPLQADGSDFPCKSTSNSGGTVTNMAIGAPQTMIFKGGATHGGGSCQISLTSDNPATKNSKWSVIHSIEGGCMTRSSTGNIGEDASAIDPDTYNYTIPTGVNPGEYTLAWTWFNKVGNREMYMNCASVKVTGGSGSKRDTSTNGTSASFPDMFRANIPTTDCQTVDSTNVQFPDPGNSIEKASSDPSAVLTPPTGPKCGSSSSSGTQAAAAGSGSGSSTSGSSAAVSGASSAPSVASSASAPDSQSSAAAGGASVSPVASAAVPSVAAPVASSASSGGAASPSSPATSGSSSSGSCTTAGALICSPDGKQFAVCGSAGSAPVFQPVASGTKCSGGAIGFAKRSAKFVSSRRSIIPGLL